ncbi:MAG TPA: hypothetical protein VMV46_12355 [Thermoanaerobaculia bacterium]|nr:hypothetical protein [Thermoanaerobaculia bacterium]
MRHSHEMTEDESRRRAQALSQWLALERAGEAEGACEPALARALGGWAPFAPFPGFTDQVVTAAMLPRRAAGVVRQWGWRVAVALVAVQSALLLGLLGATASSLVERLGPSAVVASLARGALLSARSAAELLHFGRSVSDASRVIGSAAATPELLLLLAGCLAASLLGAWLVSSQLTRGDRGVAGALS